MAAAVFTRRICSGLQGHLSQEYFLKSKLAFRPVTFVVKKAQDEPPEDHDLRNMRIGRPQSPHLTIYAPQITSMLSISHRFTGIALSTYMMGLGIGAVALPNDMSHYISMMEGLPPSILFATKFLVAFPLCYHWCNGIRHLLWDTGRFLTIKGVYNSGYTMLGVTALLTAILMAL